MPRGYRLAAKFWGSGLLDRTNSLYTGFPYASLYPVPRFDQRGRSSSPSLNVLCDARGAALVREAVNADKRLDILWSGGIDSTSALVAILKAARAADATSRVRVLLTEESIAEYPLFYDRFVKELRIHHVSAPVTQHLDPKALTVTGEHGDQIFGSQKIGHYVGDGRAFADYAGTLPAILAEELGSAADAEEVMRYIEPLLHVAPLQLRSVFDVFWWLNFALKWQIVGLRLAVFRVSDVRRVFESLRHFFSHEEFQRWSVDNHDQKIGRTWESYKMPLKDYIYSFTGDDEYRRTKVKQPSLRAVFLTDTMRRPPTYRVLMDETFEPVFWEVHGTGDQRSPLVLPRRNRGR